MTKKIVLLTLVGRSLVGKTDMAFKPLVNIETADSLIENLPWCNKWVVGRTDFDTPRNVLFCQLYDTGIMVLCDEYKGYIHQGSTLYDHLREALRVWVAQGTSTAYLQVKANRKGKITVGTDEDQVNHRWISSEGRFVQVVKKSEVTKEEATSSNPLLAGSGVRTSVEKTEGSTRSRKNTN